MTAADLEALVPNVTRVRHLDGPEATYIGRLERGELRLVVDDGGQVRQWFVSDCEVIR